MTKELLQLALKIKVCVQSLADSHESKIISEDNYCPQ